MCPPTKIGEITASILNCYFSKHICGALRDLVPFVQFKKREKHPWRSFNFSKVAGFKPATTLLKLTLLHACFSRFFNYANGTKSCNAPHLHFATSNVLSKHRKTSLVLVISIHLVLYSLEILTRVIHAKYTTSFSNLSEKKRLTILQK